MISSLSNPLVHSWAKYRLKSEQQQEIEIATAAFEIITSAVRSPKRRRIEDWIFERQVMPHIDAVAKRKIKHIGVSGMNIHDGSQSIGDVYSWHGRFNEAMEWYGRALTWE